MLDRTTAPQVQIYQSIIEIARKGDRKAVIAALEGEIAKLTGTLFALEPAKPPVDLAAKFEEFKAAYPRRKGAQVWPQAFELFKKAVKAGSNPDDIIHGARCFAQAERERLGTEFIPQAVKWVRRKCWLEYAAQKPSKPIDERERRRLDAIAESRAYFA